MIIKKITVVDYNDIGLFAEQINAMVSNGDKILSSNAYYNGETTMYYALVEQQYTISDNS
jgi:hypothetical protein